MVFHSLILHVLAIHIQSSLGIAWLMIISVRQTGEASVSQRISKPRGAFRACWGGKLSEVPTPPTSLPYTRMKPFLAALPTPCPLETIVLTTSTTSTNSTTAPFHPTLSNPNGQPFLHTP